MTYLFNSNTAITNEVEVKNDSGNALPVVGVDGSPLTVTFGGATIDAFGRLRTASPHTVFDNYFTIDDKPRVWDTQIVNSATSVFKHQQACIDMGVSTANGSKVVRQTKKYFQYQPGKSLLSLNTFVMGSGKANLRQRVGYFDVNDGIFFERESNVNYIVKRSNVSGTPQDTRVPQSQWNGELKTNGYAGINLDASKAQIFFTDVEWLGVGSVRTGFIIDGTYYFAHTFHHANMEPNIYMSQATLPVRYEIENIGITNSSSNLLQICSTVISEAGYSPAAITRSAATSLVGLEMSQTEFRPLLSIRLKSAHVDQVVLPTDINLYGLQSTPFVYKITANANISGGFWTTTGNDSIVEYNANATTLGVGGYDLLQGMFIGGTSAQPVVIDLTKYNHSLQLRANIGGIPEVLTVSVKSTTNNDDALGSISWQEHN